MARYTSCPGMLGQTNYYDESGNRVGESWPGMIEGTTNFYDTNGKFQGSSCFGLASDQVYHDALGEYAGTSMKTLYGNAYFDKEGDFVGASSESFTGEAFDFF